MVNPEVKKLRDLCAEMYIILGHLDAPAVVLDQVVAAANGWKLPHETLLPYPDAVKALKPAEPDPVFRITERANE